VKKIVFVIGVLLTFVSPAYSMTPAEEKLLFQTLGEIKGELKQINKRIEDTNRRIEDLRADMNARFKQIDKRFEQIDKRFEQVDKRFEQQFKYIELMIIGMFGLIATFAGLLFWDRKSIIGEAKRQIYEEMDSEVKPKKLKRLLKSFRELAKVDERIAEILKREGLL
jgi:uncharacterized protein YukE